MSTTLIEELEEAAQLAEGAGRKTGTLDSIIEGNHFARRLRLRAERVREWYGTHDKCDPGLCSRTKVAGPLEGE